jgi:hypothetical protein
MTQAKRNRPSLRRDLLVDPGFTLPTLPQIHIRPGSDFTVDDLEDVRELAKLKRMIQTANNQAERKTYTHHSIELGQ